MACRRAAALLSAFVSLSTQTYAAGPKCEAGHDFTTVDMSTQIADDFVAAVKSIGIKTIVRYYDWENETLDGKTLTKAELELIKRHGMSVAVVFQHNNDQIQTFSIGARGTKDAKRALELAASVSQPRGSAIYFGVDGVDEQFSALLLGTGVPDRDKYVKNFIAKFVGAYFVDVAAVMRTSGYKIGAYGSGYVCQYLLDRHLVSYCWLANATSWPGYERFAASNRWALKQLLPTPASDCFGNEVDLNVGNGAIADFGQWSPD